MDKKKKDKIKNQRKESLTEKTVSISMWFLFFSVLFAIAFFNAAFWTWILCLSFGLQFQWKYAFGMMVLIYLFGKPNDESKKVAKIIKKYTPKK